MSAGSRSNLAIPNWRADDCLSSGRAITRQRHRHTGDVWGSVVVEKHYVSTAVTEAKDCRNRPAHQRPLGILRALRSQAITRCQLVPEIGDNPDLASSDQVDRVTASRLGGRLIFAWTAIFRASVVDYFMTTMRRKYLARAAAWHNGIGGPSTVH